jgi:hypothetical protein
MDTQPSVLLNEAARAMGRKGGRAKTDAKLSACANNAKLSRGVVAQMAKHLHGRNLRPDDIRIIAIKRTLSNGSRGHKLSGVAILPSVSDRSKAETNNLRSNDGMGSHLQASQSNSRRRD